MSDELSHHMETIERFAVGEWELRREALDAFSALCSRSTDEVLRHVEFMAEVATPSSIGRRMQARTALLEAVGRS